MEGKESENFLAIVPYAKELVHCWLEEDLIFFSHQKGLSQERYLYFEVDLSLYSSFQSCCQLELARIERI
jgi:hypothetical protein